MQPQDAPEQMTHDEIEAHLLALLDKLQPDERAAIAWIMEATQPADWSSA
jgi:hypothetical protein